MREKRFTIGASGLTLDKLREVFEVANEKGLPIGFSADDLGFIIGRIETADKLANALKGIIRVADRQAIEFDFAKKALAAYDAARGKA